MICFKITTLRDGQISLIEFVLSKKSDDVYSKVSKVFVWSNYFAQIWSK